MPGMRVFPLIAFLLGMAGCGSSDAATTNFSCDVVSTTSGTVTHTCVESLDIPSASVAELTQACTTESLGTAGVSCATAGLLGSCAQAATGVDNAQTTFYYANGSFSASQAQTECAAQGGTWSAG
jgi:hypothetical protein